MVITGINNATKKVAETAEVAKRILEQIDAVGVNRAIESVTLFAAFGAFANAAMGICAIANTIFGIKAQQHLAKASKEMAEQLKSIGGSLQEMNDAAQTNLSITYQTMFAQHVYDLTDMVAKRDRNPGVPHCIFVYHPSNEWHPAFARLWGERPIDGCCGLTDNINLLLAWLPAFRKAVSARARITIVLPSAHVYVVTDALTIDPSIGELYMVGETHHTGTPYTYISISESLYGLQASRVGIMLEVKEIPLGFGHRLAKWTTTPLAGVGAGVAGGLTGFACGGLLIASLPISLNFVLPVMCTTAMASGLGAGAAAGTGAGIGVRRLWDRKEEENRERMRADKLQSEQNLNEHMDVNISR